MSYEQQTFRPWLCGSCVKMTHFVAGHIPFIWRQNGNHQGILKFQNERNRFGAVRFNGWISPGLQIDAPILSILALQTIFPVLHLLNGNDARERLGADVLVFVTSGCVFHAYVTKLAPEDDLGTVHKSDLETFVYSVVRKVGRQISGSGTH